MDVNSGPAERHPILARVLEQNIQSIFAQQERMAARRSRQDRISDAITYFSGHMVFVYLHVAWFAGWIACECDGECDGVSPEILRYFHRGGLARNCLAYF
jgi:hypothetical protein